MPRRIAGRIVVGVVDRQITAGAPRGDGLARDQSIGKVGIGRVLNIDLAQKFGSWCDLACGDGIIQIGDHQCDVGRVDHSVTIDVPEGSYVRRRARNGTRSIGVDVIDDQQ